MDGKAIGKLSIQGSTPFGSKKYGYIELGKVPVVGVLGAAIYVEVGLEYTVEGKITLVYNVSGEIGAQVLNNKLRAIKTLKTGFSAPELEATVKFGPKISGLLSICTFDLINFSGNFGGAISTWLTIQGLDAACLDSAGYVYGDLTALDKSIIGNWLNLKYTWTIWNKSNSPLKKQWHFENFRLVDNCTYGDGIIMVDMRLNYL